ncbi:MAG: fibronectin-binding domain-containing protein [Candidatus Micrarchaeota archaeon]|nr:fibronectin-binding domain-containing protein [Candidatus Micrarchaeota archaeon]
MKEMSALDILFALKEIKLLEGGRVDKIYRSGKELLIRIYVPGKGTFDLLFAPGRIHITEYKRSFGEPDAFCMLLRKYLMGKRITSISQKDFDRIVEISFNTGYRLVLEIFSKGNVILVDPEGKVVMPMEVQIWKDRQILPKRDYVYPPPVLNPFVLSPDDILAAARNSEKSLGSFLASELSLSGKYSEEICFRLGLDPGKKASEITPGEAERIVETLRSFLNEFSPRLYTNGEPEFSPFELKSMEGRKFVTASSFNRILDELFSKPEPQEDPELKKLEKIKEEQAEAIKRLREEEKKMRKSAEAIYSNFHLVESIFSGLKRARDSGLSWNEIKRRIEVEDTPETAAIKSINESNGTIVLELSGTEVTLDFRLTPQENAEIYFEKAKKLKKKLENALSERRKLLYRLRKLKKPQEKKVIPKRKKPKKWYEKFRWFITSDGFLVVAGRDATQNEVLIKKYTEPNDIVLHADIHGAPFVVIKSEGKEITPVAVREAGEFAAAYSSAWKRKMGVEVYWIRPEQVSKTPPAGEYLPKGAFMIRGRKNYLKKMEPKISIGVSLGDEAKPICGPVQAVRKHAKYFVTVVPGNMKQSDVAKTVKIKILQKSLPEDKKLIEEIDLSEFQRLIPPGEGDVIG